MKKHSLLLVIGAIALVGCGSGDETFPATTPVTGVVTQDGKPVEGAQLMFVPPTSPPAGTERTFPGTATTAADGTFEATTVFSPSQSSKGLVAGQYSVTVKKVPPVEQVTIADDESASQVKVEKPKNQLPSQYANPQSTPIKVTVSSGRPVELPIEIK